MICVVMLGFLLPFVYADINQPWTLIPEDMTPFCSGQDICRKNIDAQTSDSTNNISSFTPTFQLVFQDCCTECSCEEDCGDNVICCFPWMHIYKVKDRSYQECLLASSHHINKNAPSVLMVTSSKNANATIDTNRTDKSVSNVSCGDRKVAPWGSMLPVYSRESRLIYKNHVCARENNASDLVTWEPNFYCSYKHSYTGRLNHIAQLAYESLQPTGPDCTVVFMPPTDIIPNMKTELCYTDVIRSCISSSNGHTLINMKAEQVNVACEGGFYSPFIFNNKVYANVFCFICTWISYQPINLIQCEDPHLMSSGFGLTTIILNTDLFLKDREIQRKPKRQFLACRKKMAREYTSDCREILCPTGKVRAPNGTCVFLFSEISVAKPMLVLALYPKESFMMLDIEITSDVGKWLKSPWSNVWVIGSVFRNETYSEVTHNSTVVQIVVYMSRVSTPVSPAMVEDEMINTLPKTFQICLASKYCVKCEQQLMAYELISLFFGLPAVPLWYTRLEQSSYFHSFFQSEIKSYSRAYINRKLQPAASQVFTKMFLCHQVELNETEYEQHEMADIVFYKPNNRTLFQYEFEVVRDAHGVNKVRICLDDSDLVTETNGCPDKQFMSTFLAQLWIIITTAMVIAF